MKVWTHHSIAFPLTSPNLVIDAKRSRYYRDDKYREVTKNLHQHLNGETQFVWCLKNRKTFERKTDSIDLVEWELDVPESRILALYREDFWDDIYYRRSNNWDELLTSTPCERVGALVLVPIDPSWATPDEIPVKYPRQP